MILLGCVSESCYETAVNREMGWDGRYMKPPLLSCHQRPFAAAMRLLFT